MYSTPDTSYRDTLKEKGLIGNRGTTHETQETIRDIMTDDAMRYLTTDNIIHDRCVLDNAIYSLWKNYSTFLSPTKNLSTS